MKLSKEELQYLIDCMWFVEQNTNWGDDKGWMLIYKKLKKERDKDEKKY